MIGKKMIKTGSKKGEMKLTKQNLHFIELILKDVKVFDSYQLAGYKGGKESAYQLKHKLKPYLTRAYEIEGLSREGYKTRMLNLLKLPCVDRNGTPITNLTFNQYKEVLNMLKDQIDNEEGRKQTQPQITAFIVKTHAESKGDRPSKIIDVQPLNVSRPS